MYNVAITKHLQWAPDPASGAVMRGKINSTFSVFFRHFSTTSDCCFDENSAFIHSSCRMPNLFMIARLATSASVWLHTYVHCVHI
jgi:hypothetical protein